MLIVVSILSMFFEMYKGIPTTITEQKNPTSGRKSEKEWKKNKKKKKKKKKQWPTPATLSLPFSHQLLRLC